MANCPCCTTDSGVINNCNFTLNNPSIPSPIGNYSVTINAGGFLNGTFVISVSSLPSPPNPSNSYAGCICLESPNIHGTIISNPHFSGPFKQPDCQPDSLLLCMPLKSLSDNSTPANLTCGYDLNSIAQCYACNSVPPTTVLVPNIGANITTNCFIPGTPFFSVGGFNGINNECIISYLITITIGYVNGNNLPSFSTGCCANISVGFTGICFKSRNQVFPQGCWDSSRIDAYYTMQLPNFTYSNQYTLSLGAQPVNSRDYRNSNPAVFTGPSISALNQDYNGLPNTIQVNKL